jgi:amylosucrase
MDPTLRQTESSLSRLMPRLEARFADRASRQPQTWKTFIQRLEEHFPRLFSLYFRLYANQYDFFYHLEDLVGMLAEMWLKRPPDLQALDALREADSGWYQSNHMLGGVAYVDLFAGTLQGIRKKIAYFKELGLNYLHLMPLFRVPLGENDGGYAVSSYREVNPALGTIQELAELAADLRQNGISLVLDFVFNHTSSDHDWAQRAIAGDPDYQDFYRIFPDRSLPDEYEKNLREIFPDEHPGAFTYWPGIDKWVWTTFHSYQWDLNYANPAVFNRMAEEMLSLANNGVEVLRLDAVAFIWKQMGTNCENLPQAHWLIQAYNAVARIAAPSLLFKSEAIVHPDEVVKYIHPEECQLSYNPLLMSLLWESLATRKVTLLDQALRARFSIHSDSAWVNYVRCHDDIGWTFSDEDASRLGINGYDHRKFLNAFYTGRFEGSFARGLPFQENPQTGDARISGTCASLAGLEQALLEEMNPRTSQTDNQAVSSAVSLATSQAISQALSQAISQAIRRILLIHAVILTIGGIPLIYLGDEVGVSNDYGYRLDPSKAADSRWVHRPAADEKKFSLRNDITTVEGRIYQGLRQLIELRLRHPVFSGQEMQVIDTGSPHVLSYMRTFENQSALVFANFSEEEQVLPANLLRLYGMSYEFRDLMLESEIPPGDVSLGSYEFLVIMPH